jgi:hypothetical protein
VFWTLILRRLTWDPNDAETISIICQNSVQWFVVCDQVPNTGSILWTPSPSLPGGEWRMVIGSGNNFSHFPSTPINVLEGSPNALEQATISAPFTIEACSTCTAVPPTQIYTPTETPTQGVPYVPPPPTTSQQTTYTTPTGEGTTFTLSSPQNTITISGTPPSQSAPSTYVPPTSTPPSYAPPPKVFSTSTLSGEEIATAYPYNSGSPESTASNETEAAPVPVGNTSQTSATALTGIVTGAAGGSGIVPATNGPTGAATNAVGGAVGGTTGSTPSSTATAKSGACRIVLALWRYYLIVSLGMWVRFPLMWDL